MRVLPSEWQQPMVALAHRAESPSSEERNRQELSILGLHQRMSNYRGRSRSGATVAAVDSAGELT